MFKCLIENIECKFYLNKYFIFSILHNRFKNLLLFKNMLLYGKQLALDIKNNIKQYFSDSKFENKYIAIFLLGEDKASEVYVGMKKRFGEDVGIGVFVAGDNNLCDISHHKLSFMCNFDTKDYKKVIENINYFNNDDNCIGIVVQLPLPDYLIEYKSEILSSISPKKDIDGLGGILVGLASIDYIDFLPATPAAVLNLLKYYNLDDFKGKIVSIIGQSNLIGKPLAMEIIKRYGTVFTFNHLSDKDQMKEICKISDYIISATGCMNLIDETFVNNNKNQILVDIGWGIVDGKACGDMKFSNIEDKAQAITPVPGGIGPLTIASLFDNIRILLNQIDKIKY